MSKQHIHWTLEGELGKEKRDGGVRNLKERDWNY
jgi:hypothetical protein